MAEQPQNVVPATLVQPTVPTQGVSQFLLSLNVNEFLITLGVSTVTIGIDPNAGPIPAQIVNWLMSLSMSASAAKTLHIALGNGLEHYEKNFGKIPADPAQSLLVNEVNAQKK